jgi:hypothetical protein
MLPASAAASAPFVAAPAFRMPAGLFDGVGAATGGDANHVRPLRIPSVVLSPGR